MNNIGRNIARIRLFKMVGQKEMANYLAISQQEYSRIERKKVLPELLIEAIANRLECPVEVICRLDQLEFLNQMMHQNRTDEKAELQKVIELSERLLQEKDEIIQLLRLQLNKNENSYEPLTPQ